MFGLIRFRTMGAEMLARIQKCAGLYLVLSIHDEPILKLGVHADSHLQEAIHLAHIVAALAGTSRARWFSEELVRLRLAGDNQNSAWSEFWLRVETEFKLDVRERLGQRLKYPAILIDPQ